jgi:hypothetical protein
MCILYAWGGNNRAFLWTDIAVDSIFKMEGIVVHFAEHQSFGRSWLMRGSMIFSCHVLIMLWTLVQVSFHDVRVQPLALILQLLVCSVLCVL